LNRNHWILEDHEIHNESYKKIPPIYIILGGIYRFVLSFRPRRNWVNQLAEAHLVGATTLFSHF
mgnify:CR=1